MIEQPPAQPAQQVESACVVNHRTSQTGPELRSPRSNGSKECKPESSLKAQPGASPPQAVQPSSATQEVVVTAERPLVQGELDRRVYDVRKDLNSQTGSLADVLRNLPSVDVDPFGRVLIRGVSGVTILVDGRPSALFQGAARADALSQIPASQIEKIEVATVPSAEFTSAGTGGIINIILRKPPANHTPSGSVRTNAGNEGRSSGGVLLSSGWGKLGTVLSMNAKHDSRRTSSFDNSTGVSPIQAADLAQTAKDRSVSDSVSMHTAVTYPFTKLNALSSDIDVLYIRARDRGVETYMNTGGASTPDVGYFNPYLYVGKTASVNTSVSYKSRSPSGNSEGNLSLAAGYSTNSSTTNQSFQFTPSGSHTTAQATRYDSPSLDLNLAGSLLFKFSPRGALKGGADIKFGSSTINRSGQSADSPESLTANARLDDRFRLDRSVFASYFQLGDKLHRFSYQAGLRLESSRDDMTGISLTGNTISSYSQVFPSLHFSYALTKFEKVLLSYNKRIERPSISELDPYVIPQSPLLFTYGTPTLKPSTSESYELSYELSKGSEFRSLALYHRVSKSIISPYVSRGPNASLLTSYQNVGGSISSGVEFSQRGELRRGVTYNVYSNTSWTEFDGGSGQVRRHSALDTSLKGSLNISITKDDIIQVGHTFKTKSSTAFGFAETASILSIGARHFFSSGPFLTFTTQDPFGAYYRHQHYLTNELSRDVLQRPRLRSFSLTLTVPFGAKAKRDGNIEVE